MSSEDELGQISRFICLIQQYHNNEAVAASAYYNLHNHISLYYLFSQMMSRREQLSILGYVHCQLHIINQNRHPHSKMYGTQSTK